MRVDSQKPKALCMVLVMTLLSSSACSFHFHSAPHESAAATTQAAAAVPLAALRLTSVPVSIVAGDLFHVTVTALDGSANPITNYVGTVHFTSSDAYPATLPVDYTFVPGDHGTKQFDFTLFTAGSQTITAADAGASVSVDSSAMGVVAAAASQLVFSTQPVGPYDSRATMARDSVSALDPYGNMDANYASAITMTIGTDASHSGLAVLSGTTVVPAVTGRADFTDLSIDLPGSAYTLSATDGTLSVVSNSFAILGLKMLYVVTDDNSISSFAEQADGTLSDLRDSHPAGNSAVQLAVDSLNGFVYISDMGSNNVTTKAISNVDGKLLDVGTSPVGHSPFPLVFDSVHRVLDVLNVVDNNVTTYAINPGSGMPGASIASALVPGSADVLATDLTFTHGFSASRGGVIYSYTIAGNGNWTKVGPNVTVPSGGVYGLSIDPTGTYLFAGGTKVYSFLINGDGTLVTSPIATLNAAVGAYPNVFFMDPLGTFLEFVGANKISSTALLSGAMDIPVAQTLSTQSPGLMIADRDGTNIFSSGLDGPQPTLQAYTIDSSGTIVVNGPEVNTSSNVIGLGTGYYPH